MMDKIELKNFIVKRKQAGDSFQAISDQLFAQYGIRKDRQSLHGIYTRHMKKLSEAGEKEEDASVYTNVYIRCDNINEACEHLNKMNYKVSVSTLNNFITKNVDDMMKIRTELLEDIYKRIKIGETIDEIRDSLTYRGIECGNEKFKKLIVNTFEMIAESEIDDVIAYCLELTYDPDIMNELRGCLEKR